jgi:hypothetical protein
MPLKLGETLRDQAGIQPAPLGSHQQPLTDLLTRLSATEAGLSSAEAERRLEDPVEYVWGYWKHHELPNFCPRARQRRDFASRCVPAYTAAASGTFCTVPCASGPICRRSAPVG